MKRTMTDEQKAAILAAKAANRERRAEVMRVGEWEVFRGDEDNWILRKGETGSPRYYPTLAWALKAMLNEEIGTKALKSIAEVLAAVKSAEAQIVAAARQ